MNGSKGVKKDIIWLGVTGFGPNSNEGAYDPDFAGKIRIDGPHRDSRMVIRRCWVFLCRTWGRANMHTGFLMKALLKKQFTGEGSRIDLSMFESSVSWLTVPITLTSSFGKKITRRGNTHEFFCPVSVYQTQNGFVYMAVGNDRQWKALVSQSVFNLLDKPEYEKNAGRIRDVENVNKAMNAVTQQMTSEDLIELLQSITVPVSKIKSLEDVIEDPLVKKQLLFAKDPITSRRITLAPPPIMTPYFGRHLR